MLYSYSPQLKLYLHTREQLDLMISKHRACKYLLIYIFKVILCCKFTWYVVCHKTKTFYCDVIKKFGLLRSKYIIAVFCGLFKGFYLVVQ